MSELGAVDKLKERLAEAYLENAELKLKLEEQRLALELCTRQRKEALDRLSAFTRACS